MYKEIVKPKKNPILVLIGGIVFILLYFFAWDIAAILSELYLLRIKQITGFVLAVVLACIFVSRYVTEYEYRIENDSFTITRYLSKRGNSILSVPVSAISAITQDKNALDAEFRGGRHFRVTLPNGNPIFYAALYTAEKPAILKFQPSDKLLELLKEKKSN